MIIYVRVEVDREVCRLPERESHEEFEVVGRRGEAVCPSKREEACNKVMKTA